MKVVVLVPKLMAVWLSKFLKRPTNSRKVVITGKRVSRGGGYSLELPCEYVLQVDLFSCKKKDKKDKLTIKRYTDQLIEGFIAY